MSFYLILKTLSCRVGLSGLQFTKLLASLQKLLKTNLNLGIYIHNNLGPWHLDTSTLVPYEYVAGYFAFVLTQKAMLPS